MEGKQIIVRSQALPANIQRQLSEANAKPVLIQECEKLDRKSSGWRATGLAMGLVASSGGATAILSPFVGTNSDGELTNGGKAATIVGGAVALATGIFAAISTEFVKANTTRYNDRSCTESIKKWSSADSEPDIQTDAEPPAETEPPSDTELTDQEVKWLAGLTGRCVVWTEIRTSGWNAPEQRADQAELRRLVKKKSISSGLSASLTKVEQKIGEVREGPDGDRKYLELKKACQDLETRI